MKNVKWKGMVFHFFCCNWRFHVVEENEMWNSLTLLNYHSKKCLGTKLHKLQEWSACPQTAELYKKRSFFLWQCTLRSPILLHVNVPALLLLPSHYRQLPSAFHLLNLQSSDGVFCYHSNTVIIVVIKHWFALRYVCGLPIEHWFHCSLLHFMFLLCLQETVYRESTNLFIWCGDLS